MVNSRAEIAERYKISRARVTQVMELLRLPPEIQDYVMALTPRQKRLYSGRRLRDIVALPAESAQFKGFEELRSRVSGP